jgi:hypothetical protein
MNRARGFLKLQAKNHWIPTVSKSYQVPMTPGVVGSDGPHAEIGTHSGKSEVSVGPKTFRKWFISATE